MAERAVVTRVVVGLPVGRQVSIPTVHPCGAVAKLGDALHLGYTALWHGISNPPSPTSLELAKVLSHLTRTSS